MKIISTIFNSVKNKFTQSIKMTTNRFGWLIAGSSFMTLYFNSMVSSFKTLPLLSVALTALSVFLAISILHMIFGYQFSKIKEHYKKEELGLTKTLFTLSSSILILFLWCKIDFSYIINIFQPYLEYILFINFMIYIRSAIIICNSRTAICHGLVAKQEKQEHEESLNKPIKYIEEEKELELTHYFNK